MYFSMGHTMFKFPVFFLEKNPLALTLIQMLLAIIILIINKKFFVNGYKSLIHLAPNMDTLVALGSTASFGYSLVMLFLMTNDYINQNVELAASRMHDLYFESAAMIPTLITIGKLLEAISKGKTTNALKGLMSLAPNYANVVRDDKVVNVPIEEVVVGDIFVVKPGENIPVDGVVIDGDSAVNESSMTGESIPIDKTVGDNVVQATNNISGFIKCRATKVGDDTTLSKIIELVGEAQSTKAPISKIADRVSSIFVPTVIGIAIVTFIIWIIVGQSTTFAIARAIAVLVVSCPCALGLATPVAIMVGGGVSARNGILFKNAEALENTGKIGIVALDKTGTITKGEPVVTNVIAKNCDEEKLIYLAATLESKSEHPLGKAICNYADEKKVSLGEASEFKILPGKGLHGKIANDLIYGGNINYIKSITNLSEDLLQELDALMENGKTPLLFATKEKFLGVIAVADTVKETSQAGINELKGMGIRTVMITGDLPKTANAIAKEVGVDEVFAGVLPTGKDKIIKRLSKRQKTAMVGDGINDALALTRADIGMAIGQGTDIAVDAANVVLMNNNITDVSAAIRISRHTLNKIYQNLFWAFAYNIIGIPLAAGVWYSSFGLKLNPMFGAAAMSLSSFIVVTNALRLNLIKVHDSSKDKKKTFKENEELEVTKTIKVEGMMCGHCEKAVCKALDKIDGVYESSASFETGLVNVVMDATISDDVITKAISDEDYKVLEIK